MQVKGEHRMQQKTQTKKYTTWQNTIYMLKKVWGWSKKDILISLLHIPPSIISPLILVVLSKILVDCLTGGVTPVQLITTVGVAILIYGACCWLDKFIGGRIILVNLQTRYRFKADGFLKTLDTDYENIESLEGRIKRQRCEAFTQYGNGSGGERAFPQERGLRHAHRITQTRPMLPEGKRPFGSNRSEEHTSELQSPS